MNKEPKLIAVLVVVVVFIFSIQFLVFESYQTIFPDTDENTNKYFDDSSSQNSDYNIYQDQEKSNNIEEFESQRALESNSQRTKIIGNEITKSNSNSQSQLGSSSPGTTNSLSSSSNSLQNLNILDQNQIIDVISSKLSQVHKIEKNKITQVLVDLTKLTTANNKDPMKYLRQIATTIVKNPSHPMITELIKRANTQ